MSANQKPENELNSSLLGTKAHWEDAYDTEITHFSETGDEGEIWFGQSSARRMVQYLKSRPSLPKDDAIIDIGCGNGMLLVDMWEAGFTNLLGVDYADNAIRLAKSVAESKGCQSQFEVRNVVEWSGPEDAFNVALDKGTYDAISLDPDNAVEKRKGYCQSVHKLLKQGGIFVITSCNWTEEELISQFGHCFKHVATLPSPTFSFGGSSGSKVTTVVFEKTAKSESC